ncbi:hypothetical protein ACFXPS_16795 [Nocardia sp. NPDC059091]
MMAISKTSSTAKGSRLSLSSSLESEGSPVVTRYGGRGLSAARELAHR